MSLFNSSDMNFVTNVCIDGYIESFPDAAPRPVPRSPRIRRRLVFQAFGPTYARPNESSSESSVEHSGVRLCTRSAVGFGARTGARSGKRINKRSRKRSGVSGSAGRSSSG